MNHIKKCLQKNSSKVVSPDEFDADESSNLLGQKASPSSSQATGSTGFSNESSLPQYDAKPEDGCGERVKIFARKHAPTKGSFIAVSSVATSTVARLKTFGTAINAFGILNNGKTMESMGHVQKKMKRDLTATMTAVADCKAQIEEVSNTQIKNHDVVVARLDAQQKEIESLKDFVKVDLVAQKEQHDAFLVAQKEQNEELSKQNVAAIIAAMNANTK
jgi:hypothetical protein